MVMPYWDFVGNAVVSDEFIRLTPDRQSKRGALWNTRPLGLKNWEITLHFKIHGQGRSLFGDGFAFWFTQHRNALGDVFGSRDKFTGLGIFFDTYSNLELHRSGGAYISAMVNDGTIDYDHDQDGTHQQMASCSAEIRNLEHDTFARILYRENTLKLLLDVEGKGEWRTCFFVADVFLPRGYFVGVSAATGDLADNHDIISLVLADAPALTDEERKEAEKMEAEDRARPGGDAIPDSDADIKRPFAGRHEPARQHVGPERKKARFNSQAFKKLRHQAGDLNTDQSSVFSSWWMLSAIAVLVFGGVVGLYYKFYVVDKAKAERFAF